MTIFDSGYGGYGGGGSSSSGFRDDRRGFDEYNAGDDEIPAPRRSNSVTTGAGGSRSSTNNQAAATTTATTTKAQEKVVDLLGFDDDDYSVAPATAPATSLAFAPPSSSNAAGKAPEKALPSNPLDGKLSWLVHAVGLWLTTPELRRGRRLCGLPDCPCLCPCFSWTHCWCKRKREHLGCLGANFHSGISATEASAANRRIRRGIGGAACVCWTGDVYGNHVTYFSNGK